MEENASVAATGAPPGFASAALPWLDRASAEVDEYVASVRDGDADLREQLLHWMQFGYLVMPGAIEPELIDAYVKDVEELFERRDAPTLVQVEGIGVSAIGDLTPEQLGIQHLRLMDFHNASLAGKLIALHPRVLGFLRHVFRETVVAMQTLTFIRGSEQSTHQDYAYVVPAIPSHLAATWVALEDVHADAGPLGYYPGSHTIRKFDWGNGLFLTEESLHDEHDFAAHIERECERMGLRRDVFLARKGDVFFWHGALAHTGTGQTDPERTRRSLVTHYSSERGYPRDRRAPDDEPLRYELNGGLLYVDPRWPHAEDSFRSRADALDKPRGSKRGGLFRRLRGG